MRPTRPSRASSRHEQQHQHPMSDPKIEAVQRLYAAYGRGDVDAVLAELADDVDWAAEAASTSVPWYGSYRGKGEVPRFFKEIGSNVDVTEFTLVVVHVERDRRDRHHPLDLHGERDRQARGDVHAALVALRRRQDRVLPRLGGHRAVGRRLRVAHGEVSVRVGGR